MMKREKSSKCCRMRMILQALSLVLIPCVLFAQEQGDTIWTQTYGWIEHDVGHDVQQTDDGGYIITGYGDRGNLYDLLLIKTDDRGELLWERVHGGDYATIQYGEEVHQTADGGYIVAGTETSPDGDYDLWLIKTDSQGLMEWNYAFGGNYEDMGHSVKLTADGGYIVAGFKTGSQGYKNAYLVKTYSDGGVDWDEEYGGNRTSEFAYSVQQTADGGYVLVGKTDAPVNYDVYMAKTDATGNLTWENTFGGGQNDEAWSVIQNSDGDYIVAGQTYSFGDGLKYYLLKVDPGGALVWERIHGMTDAQRAASVVQTPDGGYAVFGGTGTYTTDFNVYLLKTDSEGILEWQRNYGDANFHDYGWGGIQADDGAYVIVGETKSFDIPQDEYQVWLLKIASEGAQEEVPTLSEWGMIVLGLLLLASGTVAVVRRRKVNAVNAS